MNRVNFEMFRKIRNTSTDKYGTIVSYYLSVIGLILVNKSREWETYFGIKVVKWENVVGNIYK